MRRYFHYLGPSTADVAITNRVKLPKTFLAVNLSDAFTFQEKERQNSEADCLEKDTGGLEMTVRGSSHPSAAKSDRNDDIEAPTNIDEQQLPPPVATFNTAAVPPAADAPGIADPEAER